MQQCAAMVAVLLAGFVGAPGFGGAISRSPRSSSPSYTVHWPGERPRSTGSLDAATATQPSETLRREGTLFLIVPDSRSQYGDYIRIRASVDGTVVRLNGRLAITLAAQEEWLFTPGWVTLRIQATDPVVMSFLVRPEH